MARSSKRPSWDALFELASSQDGHFSVRQAKALGYSDQLLRHHRQGNRIQRVRRGVYRLVHYPAADHEDLVVVWLWSDRQGVFSHQTALSLHDFSDVLPAQTHITLPHAWRSRRLRVPPGAVVHHADVPGADRTWFGAVPITSPLRTLTDCVRADLSPDLIDQAINSGLARGLFSKAMVRKALKDRQPIEGSRRE